MPFTIDFKCEDCGHRWAVTPSAIFQGRGYYRSDADFCPKCDGVPLRTWEEEWDGVLKQDWRK
jgi:hypothetical protein